MWVIVVYNELLQYWQEHADEEGKSSWPDGLGEEGVGTPHVCILDKHAAEECAAWRDQYKIAYEDASKECNYYAAIAEQLDRWYAYFGNPKNAPWIPQEWRQYMQTWFAPRELRRSLMEA